MGKSPIDTNKELKWFKCKARDMSIHKPKGMVITFWLWGDSESDIRKILDNKNIKDVEWVEKKKPSFA